MNKRTPGEPITINGKPVVTQIPPLKPDQRRYLQRILDHHQKTQEEIPYCTCKIGGPPGSSSEREKCPIHGKPRFDANFSPDNPVNRRAAAHHGLHFDTKKKCYVDAEGAKVRDKFGQPY
jgi:hypothetical protein